MSSALSVVENHAPAIIDDFDDRRVALIRETFANDAPPLEFELFLAVCRRTGLSPEARQIYFIGRYDTQAKKKRYTIQTSIDGYRLIAARSGAYAGSDDPVFDESNQKAGDKYRPDRASVTVWRIVQGVRCPFTASARWDEYCPSSPGDMMWRRMPYTLLGKCAESLALRKAFPAELSGLFSDVEMDQAGGDVVDAAVTVRPAAAPRTRAVPGGDVDVTTGEFRRVPDDTPETPPAPPQPSTAASKPATPMQRLHGHANGRKLTPDDVHALAVHWYGVSSRTELNSQQINGMIAAFDLSSDQALDDETLATEIVKAYEAVDARKASAPVPGSPEDLAAINAIVATPSTASDPEAERRQLAEEEKNTWTVMWRFARENGLKSTQDIERYLGHGIKEMQPALVHAELKSRIEQGV